MLAYKLIQILRYIFFKIVNEIEKRQKIILQKENKTNKILKNNKRNTFGEEKKELRDFIGLEF